MNSEQILQDPAFEGVVFAGEPRAVDVDIVVPVYNEQAELGSSIMLLMDELDKLASYPNPVIGQVVIADNASNDKTWNLATHLVEAFPVQVRALRIPQKGRGRALKLAWSSSAAHVMAYMDVDLSTDVSHIPQLVRPILDGRADVSFGSRLMPTSQVTRCAKREFISRTYNRMLQAYLHVGFRDAQCGFKAISSDAVQALLPLVEDNEWFFDTELLVLAERMGVAMCEFPVRWREDEGTTVHIASTVWKDLRGMKRMHRRAKAPLTPGEQAQVNAYKSLFRGKAVN